MEAKLKLFSLIFLLISGDAFAFGMSRSVQKASFSTISVDSSIARVTGNPANGVNLTSSSFTPPSNSLVMLMISADTQSNSGVIMNVSDSGNHTWIPAAEASYPTGTGSYAGIYYSEIATGAAMTVSVKYASGDGSTNRISYKIYVVTGADAITPIGAVAKGSSTTNNLTASAYSTTFKQSMIFGCATDWNALGTPTSTAANDGNTYAGEISVLSLYGSQVPNTGTAVTANFDAAGSSAASWTWVAVEVKPAGTTATADPAIIQAGFVPANSVSSASATISSTTAGNTLVVFLGRQGTVTSLGDNAASGGNTYTLAATLTHSSGYIIDVYYAKNIKAGATSISATVSGTWIGLRYVEVANLSTTAPLVAANNQDNHATSTTTTAITVNTGAATKGIVFSISYQALAAINIQTGSPFMNLMNDNGNPWAFYIYNTSGTYGAVWDAPTTSTYSTATVVFK